MVVRVTTSAGSRSSEFSDGAARSMNSPSARARRTVPQQKSVRVVIAGEDTPALSALQRSLERIPGVDVIARLTDLALVWPSCPSGDTDLLVLIGGRLTGGRLDAWAQLPAGDELRSGLPDSAEPAQPGNDVDSDNANLVATLSPRERQIFELLVTGPSNRRLSQSLGISERTVKAHIGSIMTKLGLESRLQVGLAALAHYGEQSG